MSEYEGCGVCKHTDVDAKEYPCKECIHNVVTIKDHYEPMTNADRIRNMTDEELADFLENVRRRGFNDLCCDDNLCDSDACDCCVHEWLQAEAKDGV